MEREIKTLKIQNIEVDVITYLTWGENEKIENAVLKKVKLNRQAQDVDMDENIMSEPKYVLLEVAIKKIRQNGKEIVFTREWMDNLKLEVGEELLKKIDNILKKKDEN